MRRRRSRRRVRRNVRGKFIGKGSGWWNDPPSHRRAAKKGWGSRRARKGRKGRKKAANRRRRRHLRRRRNSGRRFFRRRRRNASGGGALSFRRPMALLKAPFSLNVLKRTSVITAGYLGTPYITGLLTGLHPMLAKTPVNLAVGLVSSAAAGAAVGMIAPRMGMDVFLGGMIQNLVEAAKTYVVPMIPGMKSGFGDYLTPIGASSATPLGYLGDYLTPAGAAGATSLGALAGDDTVTEELAVYG